ncbi:hypothetical protein DMN91_006540, partial [Ooceraea biroi]
MVFNTDMHSHMHVPT